VVLLAQPGCVRRYRYTALAPLAAKPSRLLELDRYWSLPVDASSPQGEEGVPR